MKSYKFHINGHGYEVSVDEFRADAAKVTVNGVQYDVALDGGAVPAAAVEVAAVPGIGNEPASGGIICSHLPGMIIDISVREGQNVKRGDKLAVLEAMKMENEILAECDGTVTEIYVRKGDSLLEGARILKIA